LSFAAAAGLLVSAAAVQTASAEGTVWFAVLSGGNEVSGTTANAGDTNGYGSATVISAPQGRVCYAILVNGITKATLAHIHRGRAGVAGPVVVNFSPPTGDGTPGRVSGCVDIDPALFDEINTTPSNFYVNVHNEAFPAGAVRGQLF